MHCPLNCVVSQNWLIVLSETDEGLVTIGTSNHLQAGRVIIVHGVLGPAETEPQGRGAGDVGGSTAGGAVAVRITAGAVCKGVQWLQEIDGLDDEAYLVVSIGNTHLQQVELC